MLIHAREQVAPVILQNIQPDSGWLTQPVATLIAAGVAFVVAGVTLTGIVLNHLQHRDKESTAAIDRRRAEAVGTLVEALEAVTKLWEVVGDAHSDYVGLRTDAEWTTVKAAEAFAHCRTVETKLQLLALDEDRAMADLINALQGIWDGLGEVGPYDTPDFSKAWDARFEMLQSFRRTVNSLRSKYDPLAAEIPTGDSKPGRERPWTIVDEDESQTDSEDVTENHASSGTAENGAPR